MPKHIFLHFLTDHFFEKLPKFGKQIIRDLALTRSKHSSDVSVTLVKALLDDGVDERGAVEEHPLVALKNKKQNFVKFIIKIKKKSFSYWY